MAASSGFVHVYPIVASTPPTKHATSVQTNLPTMDIDTLLAQEDYN